MSLVLHRIHSFYFYKNSFKSEENNVQEKENNIPNLEGFLYKKLIKIFCFIVSGFLGV